MGEFSQAAIEETECKTTAREKRAAEIDKVTEQYNRAAKYQKERDAKHGTSHVENIDGYESSESIEEQAIAGVLYWDVLRSQQPKTALVMLLRAIGHSCTEISAGLGMEYWRVKALTRAMYKPSRA